MEVRIEERVDVVEDQQDWAARAGVSAAAIGLLATLSALFVVLAPRM